MDRELLMVLLFLVTGHCMQLPGYCHYDNATKTLECSNGYMGDLEELISELPLDTLHINIQRTVIHSIPNISHRLQMLKSLRLSHCRTEEMSSNVFTDLKNLEILSLDHNYIHSLDPNVFAHLKHLRILNLAHNHIEALPKGIFTNLLNLKALYLRHNKLRFLDVEIFKDLSKLESLDLSYNEIQHLNPYTFKSLVMVKNITIHSNLLRTLSEDMFYNLTQLNSLSLEENPWDCNCGLRWLWHNFHRGDTPYTIKHHNMIKCLTPADLHSEPLKNLTLDELVCTPPVILSNTTGVEILHRNDMTLRCVAHGNPQPTIIWVTPSGDYLTTEFNSWWITSEFANHSSNDLHYIMPYYWITNLTVLENGDLQLHNMHGALTGEYKCIAVNPGGIDEISFNVTMMNTLRGIYFFNHIVGAISVAVSLFFGTVVCMAHHITRPKCCSPDTKSISINPSSPHLSLTSDISPKRSPFLGLFYFSNTFETPSEEETDLMYGDDEDGTDTDDVSKGSNIRIRETLEDVKARLRSGKAQLDERLRERRMRMRCQLQSIRESGSQYLQTIKDSSSKTAKTIRDSSSKTASQIRSGVAVGMEQVKYHVRSMKEFCGTGDIGQTISTVTITTNVDTSEQQEIIKSVTLV